MAKRDSILSALDKHLKVSDFSDYTPIGLQVEGSSNVKTIVTGVSLNMALLEAAKEAGAEMVIVHHGMFWKGESRVLKGTRRNRVAFLLENNMTLAAYHLPLDAHPTLGNNAGIIKKLGARRKERFGDYNGNLIGHIGAFDRALGAKKVVAAAKQFTPGMPLYFPGGASKVKRLAVVSGGAGSVFEQASEAGVDLYVTGEPWEPAKALAEETGVGFLALGHHNSEKPGITALGGWVKRRFDVKVRFIDVPNPA